MATRMSYGAGRMRPARGTQLPARTAVMPIVMVGGLTAMLLLVPMTVLTVAQHSARRSAASAAQDVPTDPPMAPVVPQAVEDAYVAPAQPAPEFKSPAVAGEQAPFAHVSSPDAQATDGQQAVEPDSAQAPAVPPVPMAPAVQIGVEPSVAPLQQEEQPAPPLPQVSVPAEPAPQVNTPVQPAPTAPPPTPKVETTSQQSSTQSSPAQSKHRDDHEKGEGAKKGKRG